MKLAIDGGKPEVQGWKKPFTSIGWDAREVLLPLFRDPILWPLSGYLAGQPRGGHFVQTLESAWANDFHVKHAIAVNSATSGLMAAAFAVGLMSGDRFAVPAMTMSATAAAPMFTGAEPSFCDVTSEDFGLSWTPTGAEIKAVFITSLFGHPAALAAFRAHADHDGTFLIEDAAQSPFAMENGRFAGTVGHIGVFSLNIHKPIHCGEGGIIVTDDNDLAERMRDFINHGEVRGKDIGLNLRMPEVSAAIALTQLDRRQEIMTERMEQAQEIISAIGEINGLRLPVTRDGCTHVFYTIPFLVEENRNEFCASLRAEGVPIVERYVQPLYHLPAFRNWASDCPVAEDLYARRLFYIENCAYSFSEEQIKGIGRAFRKVAEEVL